MGEKENQNPAHVANMSSSKFIEENIPASHRHLALFFKRMMDVFGSLICLIIFLPIILITSIAVKASSPGPIIFKQTRVGMNGKPFPFYKFRSMYWNSDDQIHRQYVIDSIKGSRKKINQDNGDDPLFEIDTDPRITPIGRVIRKLGIDELPQFINVLKGDMSLVGPHPSLPHEVEKYEPWQMGRIKGMKPGITGLWQVDGGSRTSFDDMVRMDLSYIQNWSLWLDVKILVKMVHGTFFSNGAVLRS